MGCGTGHFTRWFGEQGLQEIGATVVNLVAIERNVLRVPGRGAINGTPVLDLKPRWLEESFRWRNGGDCPCSARNILKLHYEC